MTIVENMKIFQALDPDAYTAAANAGTAIDTQGLENILFILMAGDLGASATLAFKITECDTSGGTYTDITGASATTLTQASPNDSNKAAAVELKRGDWTKRYLKCVATVGTATSDVAVIAIGWGPGQFPVTQPAYVAETVQL